MKLNGIIRKRCDGKCWVDAFYDVKYEIWDLSLARKKYDVRRACLRRQRVCREVYDWTSDIGELGEESSKEVAKDDGANESTDKSLPCLFRTQSNERSPSKEESNNICHDVITNNEECREDQPKQPCPSA